MIRRLAYSVAEVAEALGVSDWTIRREITEGRLSSVRIGTSPHARLVIPADAVKALLEAAS